VKICLVCRRVNNSAGISRYVYELCKYFISGNHEVHVFTNEYQAEEITGLHLHHVPMVTGRIFEKHKLNALAKMFQVWSFALLSKIMINKNRYDIVHVQGDSLAGADVRTAHSCHLAWLVYIREKVSGIVKRLMKSSFNPLHLIVLAIEKNNYAEGGCKKIIAVSNAVADEVHTFYGVRSERITAIPNGVDLQLFTPAKKPEFRDVVRKGLGITADGIVLIFVGHEFERKGLELAIEVLKEISNRKLYLLVAGGDKDAKYKEKCAKLGVDDRVKFIGYTKDICKYYAASDIFVLPASYEPFGLVVSEAMASGLPVIITKSSGAAELIQNGVNGFLLDMGTIKNEMVKYINMLIEDIELRGRLALNARKTIEGYSWEKMGQKTEQVYGDIINGRES
jgi:UDP-glucose:(heptosyl)LPS alpha-1,3-glucosyltransferase